MLGGESCPRRWSLRELGVFWFELLHAHPMRFHHFDNVIGHDSAPDHLDIQGMMIGRSEVIGEQEFARHCALCFVA